jgi:accessory colonization factor AcfC
VPGVKILIVNGAGQNGLWEDIAGRKGNMATVKALRANIVSYAKTSADARQTWIDDRSIDIWLTWTIWQGDDPRKLLRSSRSCAFTAMPGSR